MYLSKPNFDATQNETQKATNDAIKKLIYSKKKKPDNRYQYLKLSCDKI